jgi:hypothetical protein
MGQAKKRKEEIKKLKENNDGIVISELFYKIAKRTLTDYNNMVKRFPENGFQEVRDSLKNIVKTKRITLFNIGSLVNYISSSEYFYKAKDSLKVNPNKEVIILENSEESLGFEHLLMMTEIEKYFIINNIYGMVSITKREEAVNSKFHYKEEVA